MVVDLSAICSSYFRRDTDNAPCATACFSRSRKRRVYWLDLHESATLCNLCSSVATVSSHIRNVNETQNFECTNRQTSSNRERFNILLEYLFLEGPLLFIYMTVRVPFLEGPLLLVFIYMTERRIDRLIADTSKVRLSARRLWRKCCCCELRSQLGSRPHRCATWIVPSADRGF